MRKIILILLIILIKSEVQTNAQTSNLIPIKSGQTSNFLDSLQNLYNHATHDTTRIKLLNEDIGYYYETINPDSAIFYYQKALQLAEKNLKLQTSNLKPSFLSLQATTLRYIGIVLTNKGDYDKALEYDNKSLKLVLYYSNGSKENKKTIATSYNNIGAIHMYKGDYDKALEFYFNCLKIQEEISDKNGMSGTLNNIGLIYGNKNAYNKALEFYFKSLKIREELRDKPGLADSYHNIGLIHVNKVDYDTALEFYFKSLKLKEELRDKNGLATSYNNIGIVYMYKGQAHTNHSQKEALYKMAQEYYFKSLKIYEELGDKNGIATSYLCIGNLYLTQGKPEEASKQLLHSLNISKEIGARELMYNTYFSLAQCDSAMSNFRGAFEYHKLYTQVHDWVFSKESDEKIIKMTTKYEAEKRELTIQKLEKEKLLQTETIARKDAESKKQRILLFSFLAGFIIILIFSVFLYRLFVQKKMANIVLEQQKEEISAQRDEIETQRDLVTEQKEHIEEIHKEVTDSINYAKRIQEAMLPDLASTTRGLTPLLVPDDIESTTDMESTTMGFIPLLTPETFILFRPKDVVSGDFYWSSRVNDYLIYAVADCTGHGVPGAFMSMLGISFLNEIVRKKEVTQASYVLDQLRVSIIDALKQTGESGTQKDGMDISLVVIKNQELSPKFQIQSEENDEQLNNRTIELRTTNNEQQTTNIFNAQWAGANNPLWLIRSSKEMPPFEKVASLEEMKPDKMPIAIYERMDDFTNHEIQLNSGDTIYLMSDGYEDQFGGPKGKKFLSKNLKKLLIANCKLSMEGQKNILEKTLIEWVGEGEQIDDITILGIKI
ncbi:MAG: hypothetical protein A2046_00095 [Bacteroidetes bacterium GWA2_30_7]|nr:MAG: hypothetical protein A2046_00095 [Bacteroidetes bacterium GWA2_30_7]